MCPWPGKRTPSPTELRCRDEAGGSCHRGERDPGGARCALAPFSPGADRPGFRGGPGTRGSPGPGLGHPSEPRAWRPRPVEAPQGRARGLQGHIAGPRGLAERGCAGPGRSGSPGTPRGRAVYLTFKCDYNNESVFVKIPSVDFGISLPVKDLKKVKTKFNPDGYLIKAINEGEDLIRQIRTTIKSKIHTAITLDEV